MTGAQIIEIHEHCWHSRRGPYMAVLKDGHIVQECCKCAETRIVHRDHALEATR